MSENPVLPGAEAWAHEGGPVGVLVCHGFTGNPQSMRGLAEALAAAGHTVVLPRLPGHGTHIDDMLDTRWSDYTRAVEEAYQDIAARSEHVVVVGLSMGGTLTVWLAAEHAEIAGIVCINAAVEPSAELAALVDAMIAAGDTLMDGIASDVADPDVTELAYSQAPLAPLRSLQEAVEALQPLLGKIMCPTLVMNSPEDHVVAPSNSDHLAAAVGGPVERVTLGRSYHVATIDHDRDLIAEKVLTFIDEVTSDAGNRS